MSTDNEKSNLNLWLTWWIVNFWMINDEEIVIEIKIIFRETFELLSRKARKKKINTLKQSLDNCKVSELEKRNSVYTTVELRIESFFLGRFNFINRSKITRATRVSIPREETKKGKEKKKNRIAWHESSVDSTRIAITPIVTFPITYKSCRTEAIEQKKVRGGPTKVARTSRRKWKLVVRYGQNSRTRDNHLSLLLLFFFFFFLSVEERIFARRWLPIKWKLCRRYIRVQAVFNKRSIGWEKPSSPCFHPFKIKPCISFALFRST